MRKALSSLFLAAAVATSAQAQDFTIAPEVGVNVNTMYQTISGIKRDVNFQPGFRIGAMAEYQFHDNFAITSGVRLDVNHGTKSIGERNFATGSGIPMYEKDERKYNLVYLNVPLHFVFKTNNFYDDPHFTFGIGPSFNFLLGGRYQQVFQSGVNSNARVQRTDHNINIGDVHGKDNIRMFDLGGDVFVGYNTGKNLYFKANYSIGLLNLAPAGNDANKFRNMSFGLTAGYAFKMGRKTSW